MSTSNSEMKLIITQRIPSVIDDNSIYLSCADKLIVLKDPIYGSLIKLKYDPLNSVYRIDGYLVIVKNRKVTIRNDVVRKWNIIDNKLIIDED